MHSAHKRIFTNFILSLFTKSGIHIFIVYAAILSSLFSCNTMKNVAYFKDLRDSSKHSVQQTEYIEPVIQADDILSISIQTIDPQAPSSNLTAPPAGSAAQGSGTVLGSQVIQGFLVDKEGFIELPIIGKVQLGGLSTFKARDLIKNKAAVYFKNPTVNVRYANYKITLLGEVLKPATYNMPSEKVSILDAIGIAGDLTIYGKRDNVLLIREKKGVKEFIRFDLNSSDIFKSPYFYLKQNDIIYVEPNKAKIVSSNANRTRNITIFASVLSLIIIVFTRVQF